MTKRIESGMGVRSERAHGHNGPIVYKDEVLKHTVTVNALARSFNVASKHFTGVVRGKSVDESRVEQLAAIAGIDVDQIRKDVQSLVNMSAEEAVENMLEGDDFDEQVCNLAAFFDD